MIAYKTTSQESSQRLFRVGPIERVLVGCMAKNKCNQLRAASRLPPRWRTELAVNVWQAAKQLQECQIGLPRVNDGDPWPEFTLTMECMHRRDAVAHSLLAHSQEECLHANGMFRHKYNL